MLGRTKPTHNASLQARQVLRTWKEQGHRALIFTQTRQMLDIVERFVDNEGYEYARIDGTTPIRQRIPLIEKYNHGDSSLFLMLLTTKAGKFSCVVQFCG